MVIITERETENREISKAQLERIRVEDVDKRGIDEEKIYDNRGRVEK